VAAVSRSREISPAIRDAVARWYGADVAKNATAVESFEVCEYGARPDEAMLKKLFPFAQTH